jgi:cobalt/nickel transport system ATP-binding protein
MDLLDELHEEGTTILLSTHDVELAYSWADEIILLADGRILRQAPPEEVFSDTELMNQARLTSPVLLTLYQELVKLGVLKDAVPPKGIPEMTRLIEGSFDTNPGTIYTVDTDSIDEAFLSEILQTHKSRRIGAMGTRSKKFLYNAGVSPEFTYGVVDKALLAAMIGEDTIIFTCGGMVERVDLRVSMFEEASAASIQVVKLYPNTANH